MIVPDLPNFDLTEYGCLLLALKARGYTLTTVSEMRVVADSPRVYLRHDVDLFPSAALAMARCEREAGCHSTYFLLLSALYNLRAPENRRILTEVVVLGHEIGLHYDASLYPDNREDARAQLADDVRTLERLCGQRIQTISMHEPHRGGGDPFRCCDNYINPHDPRWQTGLLYVSDSCRAWRDESLLQCFSDEPPSRVLLLTHPELWLDGSITDRMVYLREVLLPRATEPHDRYFTREVAAIWGSHAGPKQHDERVRARQGHTPPNMRRT